MHWLYGRRRFLPRLTWALLLVCFFVVFSGFAILTRLPDGSVNDQVPVLVVHAVRSPTVREVQPPSDSAPPPFRNYANGSDEWQLASPDWLQDKLLVYSAYWDNRTRPACVRVIGSALTKKSPTVMCRFDEGLKLPDVTAQKKPINEHWNLKYAGFIFSCCSAGFGARGPAAVMVYDAAHRNASVTLRVRANPRGRGYRGRLALCVKPFHYNYDRATWLVEFLEFYRMMGVDYFLLYNESAGEEVQRVLIHYQSRGIVEVLPWKMHVENQKEIRTQNMFAALNDCNYRLMYLYKYVVSVDFDEYIVPREHANYGEMLDVLDKKQGRKLCTPSYVFQNVFFYLYWSNDTALFGADPETAPRNVPYLLTQYKTRRLKDPHKHGKRSKYIALPEVVLEVGNHVTWRHTSPCKPEKVPSSVALLHHYRICEYGGFDCLKMASVQDRTAHRFGLELLDRVNGTCLDIFKSECPLSPPLGSPW